MLLLIKTSVYLAILSKQVSGMLFYPSNNHKQNTKMELILHTNIDVFLHNTPTPNIKNLIISSFICTIITNQETKLDLHSTYKTITDINTKNLTHNR